MYRKNRWMKIPDLSMMVQFTASVDMTEANFEAEDVVLTVWKDGTEIWKGAVAKAQKIANDCEISEWTVNKENDKESFAIQLLTDGDYQIGISYKRPVRTTRLHYGFR